MSLIKVPCAAPASCGVQFHFRGTKAACMASKGGRKKRADLGQIALTPVDPNAAKYDSMNAEEYRETIAAITSEVLDDPAVFIYAMNPPNPNSPFREEDKEKCQARLLELGVPKAANRDVLEDIASEFKSQYSDRAMRKGGNDKIHSEDYSQDDLDSLVSGDSSLGFLKNHHSQTESSLSIVREDRVPQLRSDMDQTKDKIRDRLRDIGIPSSIHEYPHRGALIDNLTNRIC